MENQKLYYCKKHNQKFYVFEQTNDFIKLNCVNKRYYIKQMQFSVDFFFDLLKDKQIIIQD